MTNRIVSGRLRSPDRFAASEPPHDTRPYIDFADAVDASPFGMVLTDCSKPDNPIVFANTAFVEMTGYGPEEVLGRNCRFLQGADTDPKVLSEIRDSVRRGSPIRRELLNYRKDGTPFWNELSIEPNFDETGKIVGFVGTQIDVSDRRRAQDAQADLEARLASIAAHLPGYLFQRVLKPDGTFYVSYISDSFWDLLGVHEPPPPPYGLSLFQYVDERDKESSRNILDRSLAELSPATNEFRAITSDGKLKWFRSHSRPRILPNGDVVWDGIGIDITAERASQEALAHLAQHDPVTRLRNLALYTRSLTEAAAGAAAHGPLAMFAVSLVDFQEISDTMGSSVGDAALRCIAARLVEFAGASGIAARVGSDEFHLFRSEAPGAASALDSARDLCRELGRPVEVEGHDVTIEVCVGASVYPAPDHKTARDTEIADEIIKQASFALSEARRAGRGVVRLYSTDLDERERNRVVLRQTLKRAVSQEQFALYYHPIVDLASGHILGAEALVRWAHPGLGIQPPEFFIPLAESTGLIVPLGKWILRSALREQQEWERLGLKSTRVAVNISGAQLRDPDFISMVDEVVAESGGDPRAVSLELTESILIEASARPVGVLNALKKRGFRIALDDFGTGYSSFQYLRTLPIDEIKIDQMFVRRMVVDSSDASIVRAIVTVASSLGVGVIGEGIETPTQRAFLRREGCDVGQGYLFGLPMSAQDFRELLMRRAVLPA